MTIEFTISLRVPPPIACICVATVLLYRRLCYGYAFRKIQLSKGKYAIVDNCDFDRIGHYKWYTKKAGHTCYAQRTEYKNGRAKTVAMHREIMNASVGLLVDHINHNGLDNRRSNLRIVTPQQNSWNTRLGRNLGKSKYKGVAWNKNTRKWRANICIEKKPKYLGFFEDEKEAAKAYDRAAKKHRGEYAFLNFGDDRAFYSN